MITQANLNSLMFHLIRRERVVRAAIDKLDPESDFRGEYAFYGTLWKIVQDHFQQHQTLATQATLMREYDSLTVGDESLDSQNGRFEQFIEEAFEIPDSQFDDAGTIERVLQPLLYQRLVDALQDLSSLQGLSTAQIDEELGRLAAIRESIRLNDRVISTTGFQPVDLQYAYDQAPPLIREYADTLIAVGGNSLPNHSILAAYLVASNLLGKQLAIYNQGRCYYAGRSAVLLAPTGSNKVWPEVVEDTLRAAIREESLAGPINWKEKKQLTFNEVRVPPFDMKSALTLRLLAKRTTTQGVAMCIGDFTPKSKLAKLAETERITMEGTQISFHRLNPAALAISSELVGTLDYLVTNGSNSPSQLPVLLEMFDSGRTTINASITNGYAVIGDQSFNVLGTAQPRVYRDWRSKFDAENSGLLGRVLPFDNESATVPRVNYQPMASHEASQRLTSLATQMMKRAVHGKDINAKLAVDFSHDDGGQDWAGRYYEEATAEMGEEYTELCKDYRFDTDLGLRGKVFWYACPLTAVTCFFRLSELEVSQLRLTRNNLRFLNSPVWYTRGDRTDLQEGPRMAAYEAEHVRILTGDKLRDPDVFKFWVKTVIRIFAHELRNSNVDVQYAETMRRIARKIKDCGGTATRTQIHQASLREPGSNGQLVRLKGRDIDERIGAMIESGYLSMDVASRTTRYTLLVDVDQVGK